VFHVKQGYFITGTGTGVGKTFVTASLARRARFMGQRVLAYKPIETGCRRDGGRLIGADQEELVAAAGSWQTGVLTGAYQFEPPVAPSVAARLAHQRISIAQATSVPRGVLQAAQVPGTTDDVNLVLVEGAGGWRVPITETQDMSDLARACNIPVLVVATATLGTINHSLLTIEAIERDGQRCAGLVLSQRPDDDPTMVVSNLEELRARWPGVVVALERDLSVLDVFLQVAS
jgi:dethiobiotin synthetase